MKSTLPLLFTAALAGCASTTPKETQSLQGAQRAFFPDRYEYKVADFVLSLPIDYDELAMHRLAFAGNILKDGMPRPVLEQEKYLVMPEYALSPKRHFLVLDQKHLLIFSEMLQLDAGYPPRINVLERDDATWIDVTKVVAPEWTRSPRKVDFARDYSYLTVTSSDGKRTESLRWNGGRLTAK
jgi:hypothetical protein